MKGGAPERAQAGRVDGVGRHECRSHADDAPVWVPRAACRLGVSSDREYAEVQQGGAEDNAEHQAADGTEIGGCTMVCHVLVNTPGRCRPSTSRMEPSYLGAPGAWAPVPFGRPRWPTGHAVVAGARRRFCLTADSIRRTSSGADCWIEKSTPKRWMACKKAGQPIVLMRET